MTSPPPVSRAHRLLDLLAAATIIGGAALFGVAFVGLERLRNAPEVAYSRGMSIEQLSRYHQLSALSWVGLAAVVAGIAIGAYSMVRHRTSRSTAR